MATTKASRQKARAAAAFQRKRTRDRIKTERERKKNQNPGEWDGYQGRGQRARKYWWAGFAQGTVLRRGPGKTKKRYGGKPSKMAKSLHKPQDWF